MLEKSDSLDGLDGEIDLDGYDSEEEARKNRFRPPSPKPFYSRPVGPPIVKKFDFAVASEHFQVFIDTVAKLSLLINGMGEPFEWLMERVRYSLFDWRDCRYKEHAPSIQIMRLRANTINSPEVEKDRLQRLGSIVAVVQPALSALNFFLEDDHFKTAAPIRMLEAILLKLEEDLSNEIEKIQSAKLEEERKYPSSGLRFFSDELRALPVNENERGKEFAKFYAAYKQKEDLSYDMLLSMRMGAVRTWIKFSCKNLLTDMFKEILKIKPAEETRQAMITTCEAMTKKIKNFIEIKSQHLHDVESEEELEILTQLFYLITGGETFELSSASCSL